jgi:hypothetical protein
VNATSVYWESQSIRVWFGHINLVCHLMTVLWRPSTNWMSSLHPPPFSIMDLIWDTAWTTVEYDMWSMSTAQCPHLSIRINPPDSPGPTPHVCYINWGLESGLTRVPGVLRCGLGTLMPQVSSGSIPNIYYINWGLKLGANPWLLVYWDVGSN